MGKSIGNIVKFSSLGMIDPNAGVEDAAKATREGAAATAAGQQQAMDYLKQQGKLPSDIRNKALTQLGGVYGLSGFDPVDMTGQAMNSPIYKAMSSQIDQSLMDDQNQAGASASAKGLLGSGVLADALAKYRARAGVDKSQALAQAYQQQIGGITGLSGLNGYEGDIASLMAGKGATIGQGITGAEQARQQGYQNNVNNLMEIGKIGATAFSDIRLKDNVRLIGKIGLHEWYTWTWNDVAAKLGLRGSGEGVMAHLVEKYAPHAIGENSGFMTVNYNAL